MVDVWGDVLRPPQCTTPAAVKANKNTKVCSFNSKEHIRKKVDGPNLEVSAKKPHQWPCNDFAMEAKEKHAAI